MSTTPAFDRLLVPLDGSPTAEHALPLALALADRAGAELHLVSVVSPLPPLVTARDREGQVKGWFAEEGARAREYLRGVEERIRAAGGSGALATAVLTGAPARLLAERVRSEGLDGVVMTTHGRGTFRRFWLGSVADGLVRQGPCPILLQKPGTGPADLARRPEFRRILAPLDGSRRSAAVLPHATALARLFDGELTLLHVASPSFPFPSAYVPPPVESDPDREARLASLRERLEGLADRVRSEGISVDTDLVTEEGTADAILRYRERIAADLVVLATRGRGGIARMVLGSVADKVIRAGEGPLFLHRPSPEEESGD